MILVISAHWEESGPVLFGTGGNSLLYDYYGFPQEAYEIQYPAPGAEDELKKIITLLERANFHSSMHKDRGYDHGVFVPLALMYPEANIPVIQLSLLKSLDPKQHIELGKALSPLLDENILILGSGFSFHNMNAFVWRNTQVADTQNESFQDWLIEVCTSDLEHHDRESLLIDWESAPGARYCHPREEHLLPLHVCVGMATTGAELVFDDYTLGKRAIGLLWKS
jgi:aromatic ring-opening dioxygenase catalytic subunit (LigB family)